VADFVGAKVPDTPPYKNEGKSSRFLSMITSPYTTERETVATRKVGIIIADGYDEASLTAIRTALKGAGALTLIVAPRSGNVITASGAPGVKADFSLHASRSVLFDAFIVGAGEKAVKILSQIGLARAFLNEAFKHHKVIGAVGEGVELVRSVSSFWPDVSVASPGSSDIVNTLGVITIAKYTPSGNLISKAASAVGVGSSSAEGPFEEQFLTALKKHKIWNRNVDVVAA